MCVGVCLHLQTLCAVVHAAVFRAFVLPVTTKTQGVKTENTANTVCHETHLKETQYEHSLTVTVIIIHTELLIQLNDTLAQNVLYCIANT